MKTTEEISLSNFEFWGGAKDRAKNLSIPELDIIENTLNELYPQGIDATQLNDIFWFDFDWVVQLIGYQDEEDFDNKRDND